MYSFASLEDVKAATTGRWFSILTSLGVPENCLSRKHGPCPACGGRDRFRFDDKDGRGTFYCNGCGPGDGFKLVQLWLRTDFKGALKAITNPSSMVAAGPIPNRQSSLPIHHTKRREHLRKTWSESRPVAPGDPVHRYLCTTRGLYLPMVPVVLRYHPALPYFDDDRTRVGDFPAMLALVSTAFGKRANLHRTYLTADGKKAPVPKVKKMMSAPVEGATKGGAIRLYEATDALGIAEGIETAIACHLASGLPTWAAVSAGMMKKVILPDSVREVVVFADNDRNHVGQDAARELAHRLANEGKHVKLLVPPQPGCDWLDVVMKDGP